MSAPGPYRYLSVATPPREDRRFVLGKGTFVADVRRPGMLEVALVGSPAASGRIERVDARDARAMPGVVAVVDGAELAAGTHPLHQYLDLPAVVSRPLAHGHVRYAGEWVAAVVAETRALAEDAAELVSVDIEPLPAVTDAEGALRPDATLVHPDHGSNVAYRREFTWGDVDGHFAAADRRLGFRVRWGRSSTVPLEAFGVLAEWDLGHEVLDVWASVQMPRYADQLASALGLPLTSLRVHFDVDVGGSYGTKRGLKHSVLVGYLARRVGRPVRLIEDRIENMRAGDAHGPDRIFDVDVAYADDGRITSLQLRCIDDEGAYPGRAPMQLGKPIGAIVGPYRIESVRYEAVAVMTNKAAQSAVRGFGQSPTNYAIESAVERVARDLGLDAVEVRRRNLIPPSSFPYTIPSGTEYDSGDYEVVLDKALDLADIASLRAARDRLRSDGYLAGIGVATCLEPSGGNAMFEALMNPKNENTTFPEGCRIKVDVRGLITVTIPFSSAGQSHETMVATLTAEELGRDPDSIRVVRADSQQMLPTLGPIASRTTIMVGSAVAGAAAKLRDRMTGIAAHNLGVGRDLLVYEAGDVVGRADQALRMTWDEIVQIAHRQQHRMPQGSEPGLEATAVAQVPRGGTLPDADGRVQMYPCFAFSAHVVLARIDPGTCRVGIDAYNVAHDCGTVVNPDVVRGMVLGGIAHGIGAALYEEFRYGSDGQPLSTTFMDYLLPSMSEVPSVRITEHCTPSPWTSHGQKGVGEGGYMAAPAAVAAAVNDALAPEGIWIDRVPIRPLDVWEALRQARRDREEAR